MCTITRALVEASGVLLVVLTLTFLTTAPGVADTLQGTPVQYSTTISIAHGNLDSGSVIITTVPAGKRLIIEHASVRAMLAPGQKLMRLHVLTTVGGINASHFRVPTFLGRDGAASPPDVFVASQLLRAYADAVTTVQVFVRRYDSVGGAFVRFTISGQLVSATPPASS